MNLKEAMESRHAVREFTEQEIEGNVLSELLSAIEQCNKESELNIQLCLNEPHAFSGGSSKNFKNAFNYIAIVGKKGGKLEEKGGYYGQKIVLKAQQLGLNTCWVYMTYSKGKSDIVVNPGEKIVIVIAIGYGKTQGKERKSKTALDVSNADANSPEWFVNGVKAALLAPTAVNQQKFRFILQEDGDTVRETSGFGFCTKIDLGIAKYQFEIGAGDANFKWAGELENPNLIVV